MRYKIGIYGISGSGKTTLIKNIVKYINDSEFFEGSKVITNLKDIELFKKLPDSQKYKIREKVIDYINSNSTKKYVFVDGHYSFIKEKSFEIAITKTDINFYTHIFYIDISDDFIKELQEDDKSKKRSFSLEQIKKWKEFEKSELQKMCINNNINFYTLTSHDLEKNMEYIYEILNKENLTNTLKQLIENNRKNKYILFDADKTIVGFDSGKDYIYKMLDIDIKKVESFFKKDGYCFGSFLKLSMFHSKIPNDKFINVMKSLALKIDIEKNFLDLMKKYNKEYNICIVTAGFRILWQEVLKKHSLNNIKVIGGNNLNIDSYIIDNNLKGFIAKYLQQNNKYVISFGDSLVDKDMLINSHKGFFIVREKIREDVISILKNYKHIKYLSIHSLKVNKLEEVDFYSIEKELANENI
jgi:adenylate kinase